MNNEWRFRPWTWDPEIRPLPLDVCDTPGCSRFAAPGRGFCLECEDQLWQLNHMAFLRDGRRPPRPSSLRILGHRIRRRLWILNLLFVFGVLMYFACAWIDAIVGWLSQ